MKIIPNDVSLSIINRTGGIGNPDSRSDNFTRILASITSGISDARSKSCNTMISLSPRNLSEGVNMPLIETHVVDTVSDNVPTSNNGITSPVPPEIADRYEQWLAEQRRLYQPPDSYFEQIGYTPLSYGGINSSGVYHPTNCAYWFMPWLIPEEVLSRNPLADAYGLMAMMGFSVTDIPMAYDVLTGNSTLDPATQQFYMEMYRRLSQETGIYIAGLTIIGDADA